MFLFYHICDKLKSTMIDIRSFCEQMNGAAAPMCARDADTGDLVHAAQIAMETHARRISVDAAAVSTVWPWLENSGVKISARFAPTTATAPDARISDLAARINAAFKQGADAAQVFVNVHALDTFVDDMRTIRDDLFFNRHLSVALDLGACNALDWAGVFDALGRVRADSVLFTLTNDTGDKSDFVGRVYSMLATDTLWRGQLHFALGRNLSRIEQVVRLTRAMRPERLAGEIFFINN